jgi:flagellar hook-associated protein 1
MSNLIASLINSTGALRAYGRVLDTVQNNVVNASTPGYAKHDIPLCARQFLPDRGVMGGVAVGKAISTRDEYAEQAVRRELTRLGESTQKVDSLASLESGLDIGEESGVPGALNELIESFSAWSADPDGVTGRQQVIDQANRLAEAFRSAARGFSQTRTDTERQIEDTVARINELAGQLRDMNVEARSGSQGDAGLDARMHNTLDELSQLADVSAVRQEDGSFTVLLGGQILLVTGDRQYNLSSDLAQPQEPPPAYDNGPPYARVADSGGQDITGKVTGGKLGALLDIRNRAIPEILGDAYQAGDLNRLAKEMADRVNTILRSGNVSDGPPAVAGTALFSYDTGNDTAAAETLAVDSQASSGALAAIDPGPPYAANGIALRLAALGDPTAVADEIDGDSYTRFYARIASRVGAELSSAREDKAARGDDAAQAKDVRQQVSGVSLDEEAALLIEFQRAYQATAKMIAVLDELTQDTLNILR